MRKNNYLINQVAKTILIRFSLIIGSLFHLLTLNASNILNRDSIPIEYDPNKRGIIINTILNDSINLRLFFDTGVYGLIVADSLNINNETDTSPKYIQIGKNKIEYYNYPKGLLDHISYKNPVFSWFEVGGIIGWDFFEEKIIEISYKNKYIKYIDYEELHTDYQKFKMKKENNKWGIEGCFVLQNKQIQEYVMIDTGNTSTITFNTYIKDKYNISLEESKQGFTTSSLATSETRWIIPSDTLKIGHYFILDKNVAFRGVERRSPFAGLLGNLFLENYSIILDFKNEFCYIKEEK